MKWEEVPIGSVGRVITGNTPPKSNKSFYGGVYKFIKPTDIEISTKYTRNTEETYSEIAAKKYKNSMLPPKTTCVVTIGSIGKKITMTDSNCFVNQAINAVIPDKNRYDEDFIFYALKFILPKVKNADTGASSGRENVSKSNFSSLTILTPKSIETQRRIAGILSAFDDLIENNSKRIRLLEESAQLLYKEWFVNFRFPGHESTKFVNGLPEGWERKPLSTVLKKLESGSRPKGGIDKSMKNGYPSLGAESIMDLGVFDYSKEKFISEDFAMKMRKGLIEDRDILLYKDGAYIGKTTLFQDSFPYEKSFVNEHVYLLRATEEHLQYYLYNTLHLSQYYELLQSLNSNSAQPGLNKDKIQDIEINLPELHYLIIYDKNIGVFMKLLFNIAKQNAKLKQARDLLLPKLLSGEIEV